jgi:hypothetical protein
MKLLFHRVKRALGRGREGTVAHETHPSVRGPGSRGSSRARGPCPPWSTPSLIPTILAGTSRGSASASETPPGAPPRLVHPIPRHVSRASAASRILRSRPRLAAMILRCQQWAAARWRGTDALACRSRFTAGLAHGMIRWGGDGYLPDCGQRHWREERT